MSEDLLRDDDIKLLLRESHLKQVAGLEGHLGKLRLGLGDRLDGQIDARRRTEFSELVRKPTRAASQVEDRWTVLAEEAEVGQDLVPAPQGPVVRVLVPGPVPLVVPERLLDMSRFGCSTADIFGFIVVLVWLVFLPRICRHGPGTLSCRLPGLAPGTRVVGPI